MPDINIASGGGGGRKYVIFRGYCLYVPRVLARVADVLLSKVLSVYSLVSRCCSTHHIVV